VHQGSVLSLLLFAIVMDALTAHLTKDMREFLYADDLAILGNCWEDVISMLDGKKLWKAEV